MENQPFSNILNNLSRPKCANRSCSCSETNDSCISSVLISPYKIDSFSVNTKPQKNNLLLTNTYKLYPIDMHEKYKKNIFILNINTVN